MAGIWTQAAVAAHQMAFKAKPTAREADYHFGPRYQVCVGPVPRAIGAKTFRLQPPPLIRVGVQ
ncbi:MAG: hypothetical protein SFZ03_05940 [Candidatus Melainabacteria bacterium]|nr:hypothetical protein [Candidatus Melainabacteria bacterium]